MRERVNEKGQYCPVQGTTVISTIREADNAFWRNVYTHLKKSPTFCRYYAPLPYKSYHMTCFSLDTADDISPNEDWNTFVNERIPFYSKLYTALSIQPTLSNVKLGFLGGINVILLEVYPTENQKKALQEFAEQQGCEDGIPITFHITLAYRHQELTEEDSLKIDEELEPLRNIFKKQKRVELSEPQLCYFNDMTRFIPWNGITNPFIAQPSSGNRLYRFYSTIKAALPTIPDCHAHRKNLPYSP